MHRRSFLGGATSVGIVGFAGCVIDGEEWDTVEAWVEDTFSLVDAVGETLEAWSDDPDSVPLSEFEDLAERTTEHLDRFREEIEPIKDGILDEEIEPENGRDSSGDRRWDAIDDLEFLVSEAETGTDGIVAASGIPADLEDEHRAATETVIEERDEIFDEAEAVVA